jgi:hypothetical protein
MNDESPMTTGDWFFTLLLLSIPFVNVVCFIIWLVGVGNRNRVNFCRGSLLLSLIGILLVVLLSAAGVTLASLQGV